MRTTIAFTPGAFSKVFSASTTSSLSLMTPFTSTTPTLPESDTRLPSLPSVPTVSANVAAKNSTTTMESTINPRMMGCPCAMKSPSGAALLDLLVAVEPELFAENVLERELRILALAAEVAVDLVALLAALQGLDAEPDAALAGVDVGDFRFDGVADVEELRR